MSDEKGRLYRCPVCDTVVEVLDRVGIELVCCGPAMIPLRPRTARTDAERHLPLICSGGKGLTIVVGAEREHPMDEDHYIEWIEVSFDSKCFRHFLRPGQKPQAAFEIDPCDREVAIQAYCNVHGLWRSVERISSGAFFGGRTGQARTGKNHIGPVPPVPASCPTRDAKLLRAPL